MKYVHLFKVAVGRYICVACGNHWEVKLTYLNRCTCVADGTGVRRDCVTADDEEFCRCVVNNAGDTSQVCSCTSLYLL